VSRGVHVRAGLEDAPFGIGRSNAELVRATAATVVANGARLASPADVRDGLRSAGAAQ
jgi:uncharacterized protein (DUF849 family)